MLTEGEEEELEVGTGPLRRRAMRHAVPGELRLSQRTAEEAGLDGAANVLDRARRGGDGDAVSAGDVGRSEGARAMELESGPGLTTNSCGDGDVHRTLARAQELPQRRSARVTQDRPVPRREHRRQPPPPPREASMPDRINAAVQSMKPPRLHPPSHFRSANSRITQLLDGHDPMLSTGERRNLPVRCGAFLPHTGSKAPRHRVSPPRSG